MLSCCRNLTDYLSFYDYVSARIPATGKTYLIFDELQAVEHWEKAIESFRLDFDVDIYITGSNAYLLSAEFSTLLSGRYVEIRLLPLSFKEFLIFYEFEPAVTSQVKGKTFIFYSVGRYDVKGKQLLKTLGKNYITDMGFRNMLLGYRDSDRGHILENIVFLELLCRDYRVYIGKVGETEIDFVAEKPDDKLYIQVTLTLSLIDKGKLFFKYKHRHRRTVSTIVILINNDRIFFGRQFFQTAQYAVLFLKSCLFAAVNTQAHHTLAF